GGSLGAAAVLVRSLGGGDFRLPHTGLTLYGEGVDKVPAAAITAEDAELLARLSKQGPVTMRLTLTPKTLPPTSSYNVIADWKGRNSPKRLYWSPDIWIHGILGQVRSTMAPGSLFQCRRSICCSH
ncbi:MAG TPA: hypothetical protein VNZ03_06925, partial [Terriglobales bacterium]|nr:hypothetical protein [Terriglobales bacterium]